MNRKILLAVVGAIAIAVAASSVAAAVGSGPAVTVQIRTLTKTLRQVVVHGEKGWITKAGAPKGKCPGSSAAGALDAATHGKWSGTYYPSLRDYFITSILGKKPKSPDFWEILVNGKASSTGACGIKLHAGEKLLFKIVK